MFILHSCSPAFIMGFDYQVLQVYQGWQSGSLSQLLED